MENKRIVCSALTCLSCKETLISRHRHCYVVCSCKNNAFIDGGLVYVRYGANNIDAVSLNTVYAEDPIEVVREFMERGGRGKNGDEPLTYVKLKDINDEWLQALLIYPSADWYKDIIKREIEFRKTL